MRHRNELGVPVVVHLHAGRTPPEHDDGYPLDLVAPGAPFQVLGGAQGWKDTVDPGNGDQAEVLIRFDGYRGMYVLHCHNLEHEDMMMMANFQVR